MTKQTWFEKIIIKNNLRSVSGPELLDWSVRSFSGPPTSRRQFSISQGYIKVHTRVIVTN